MVSCGSSSHLKSSIYILAPLAISDCFVSLDISGYIYLWLWIYVLFGLDVCFECGVLSDPISKLNSTKW